jgi:hypothetical protein
MADEVIALSLSCVDGGAIYEARRHAWAAERVWMIADEMLHATGYSRTMRCATARRYTSLMCRLLQIMGANKTIKE